MIETEVTADKVAVRARYAEYSSDSLLVEKGGYVDSVVDLLAAILSDLENQQLVPLLANLSASDPHAVTFLAPVVVSPVVDVLSSLYRVGYLIATNHPKFDTKESRKIELLGAVARDLKATYSWLLSIVDNDMQKVKRASVLDDSSLLSLKRNRISYALAAHDWSMTPQQLLDAGPPERCVIRASGLAICSVCFTKYLHHPRIRTEGFAGCVIACDGRILKL